MPPSSRTDENQSADEMREQGERKGDPTGHWSSHVREANTPPKVGGTDSGCSS